MKGKYVPGCEHCPGGLGLEHPIFDDEDFWIVCDCHPLVGGHILIIPKRHISCMGSLSNSIFRKFEKYYQLVKDFVERNYGNVVIFEHGITGQTVFHAHVHFFPCKCRIDEIVPEKRFRKSG